MRGIIYIESAAHGVLTVNGCFCGPLEGGGQAFPAGADAEVYVQLFPFSAGARPLTAALTLSGGRVTRLEPQDACYALCWPEGVVQLELRPADGPDAPPEDAEQSASGALLRYLALRLRGDAGARALLLDPAREPSLPAYDAVVPLRFSPSDAGERFDERAGLVRRLAPNVAEVLPALAVTVPAGRGHRLIERVEVLAKA